MKKSILNLDGVQKLSKKEQKAVTGSRGYKICCEWCEGGTCQSWTTPGVPCPIAAAC